MWQEERRRHIRSMLATFGTLSVDRLTEDFGVLLETIRRDLMEMKESGELRRVRGGVVPVAKDKEAPCQLRTAVRSREKRTNARAAAAMVEAGQTILLDAGSTTTTLAQRSAQMEELIVVTNSLNAAKCLTSAGDCTQRGNRG
ncbi:DeoR family transcriptional regulator [Bradyrhizobium uaiense]|uniref:DeoR/GlpR transcriptional regulator n=1 Tax=Bradyrhizobium uaiense TaxID=2594946 RepID=A0A6P1BF40_9BRAD|nr:DeoR family transcriptional regulator [Bradyrhizobium uaiense]NEU97035.1 DeoR/GlpR transcriptional regulator [Bradyrhizobium uaiense]